ncbi:MAG: hypothetical protein U9R25_03295 [Chloroflexota bacterium]|nr:hypothetical protein [Chloroflexota bacterium]
MTANSMSPNNVLVALSRMEPDLPDLLSLEDWQADGDTFSAQLEMLRQSTDPDEQLAISQSLIDLLTDYPVVNDRLQTELHAQAMFERMLTTRMSALAETMGIESDAVEPSITAAMRAVHADVVEPSRSTDPSRLITIKAGGRDGGEVIKLSNLTLDLATMASLLANTTLIGASLLHQTNPILIAASILSLIVSFREGLSVELSEQDATVFWGLVKACDWDQIADEAAIISWTNYERERVGMPPLHDYYVKRTLEKLEDLKCIRPVKGRPDTWRLVDRYVIRIR